MTGNDDDQASTDGLSALKRHFGPLKAGEKCLLEEMKKGEVYHKSDEFLAIGIDRARRRLDAPKTVRSEFVRWICLSTKFHEQVRLRQITLFGFELTGCLDLESVTIPLPLIFKCCSFNDDVILKDAQTRQLSFEGSELRYVDLDRVKVSGSLLFKSFSNPPHEPMECQHPCTVEHGIRLCGAEITGNFDCRGAIFGRKGHGDTPAIFADGLSVRGNALLCAGLTCYAEVRLNGAKIDRNLDFSAAKIESSTEAALTANSIIVGGDVYLRKAPEGIEAYKGYYNQPFHCIGAIRLVGAHIVGSLECAGADLTHGARPWDRENTKRDGTTSDDEVHSQSLRVVDIPTAFSGAGMRVDGSVNFGDAFRARGVTKLINAQIGRDLNCRNSIFDTKGTCALIADGADIRGTAFLDDGFETSGIVKFVHAVVRNGLWFGDANFTPEGYDPLQGRKINEPGWWFKHGERGLDARYVEITGKFEWRKIEFGRDSEHNEEFRVDLFHARATLLQDDEASWPIAKGKLDLVGFEYNGIYRLKRRERWRIDLIHDHHGQGRFNLELHFDPAPYVKLGNVLGSSGYKEDEKRLAVRREKDATQYSTYGWWERNIWRRFLLGILIGYGYRPARALIFLLVLGVLTYPVFQISYENGGIVPARRAVSETPTINVDQNLRYPDFNPALYALDTLIPIANLRQLDYWIPDVTVWADPKTCEIWNNFWEEGVWCAIKNVLPGSWASALAFINQLSGWVLTTFFVAGVTGLVRRK